MVLRAMSKSEAMERKKDINVKIPRKYNLLLKAYLIKRELKFEEFITNCVEKYLKTQTIPMFYDQYKKESMKKMSTTVKVPLYYVSKIKRLLKENRIPFSKWLTFNIIDTIENEDISLDIDENKLTSFNCKISKKHYKVLRLYCLKNDLKQSDFLEKVILDYLDNEVEIKQLNYDCGKDVGISIPVKQELKTRLRLRLNDESKTLGQWLSNNLELLSTQVYSCSS